LAQKIDFLENFPCPVKLSLASGSDAQQLFFVSRCNFIVPFAQKDARLGNGPPIKRADRNSREKMKA
jgi:hypothetical protein